MSEVSGGPGWWIASDGKWYPPHLHPDYQPPAAPPPQPPAAPAQPPGTPPQPSPTPQPTGFGAMQAPGQPGAPWTETRAPTRFPRRPLFIGLGVAAVVLVVIILVAVLSGGNSSAPFADGTPSGEGFACRSVLFLSWTTSGGQLHGVIQGPVAGSADRAPLTGTQSGDNVTLIF